MTKIKLKLTPEDVRLLVGSLLVAIQRDEIQLNNLRDLLNCDEYFSRDVLLSYGEHYQVVFEAMRDKDVLRSKLAKSLIDGYCFN